MSSNDPLFGQSVRVPEVSQGAGRRPSAWWVAAVRLGGLAALALLLAAPGRAALKVGDAFPLPAAALADGLVAPGKVILVDFWASWCAPCKASFPVYAQLNSAYAARGLQILAVSVDEKPAAYAAFLKKMNPPFATLLDQDHQLARAVSVPAMPTCFLVGPDGRVRFVHTGFHDGVTERDLRREIEAVLAETSPSS